MTKKHFLEFIDNIDDRFIGETEEDLRKREEGAVRRRFPTSAMLGAAACAAAAAIFGVTAVSYYRDRDAVLPNSGSALSSQDTVQSSGSEPQDTVQSSGSESQNTMPESGFTEIGSLSETANAEFSALRQNGTGKLDFSNAELTLPDITGDLYRLKVSPTPAMSTPEMLELFQKSVKHIFPNSTMTGDIDNYFWYRYSFMPYTDEYIKRIQSGDIKLKQALYDTTQNKNNSTTDNEYLLLDKNGAVVIRQGEYDPLFFSPYVDYNYLDRYILSGAAIPADGNEGVYKAAAFCEEYFSNIPSFTELPIAKRMSAEVMPTDDGLYKVTLARSFNGVLFDTLAASPVIMPIGWPYTSEDPTYVRTDTASALVSEDGKLLYARIDSYNDILTPEGERIDSIISLERAVELAEQNVKFKREDLSVENVSLVYFDKCDPPYLSSYDSGAQPNWRFKVLGTDTRSGKAVWYYVYIDALDETVVIDTEFIEE